MANQENLNEDKPLTWKMAGQAPEKKNIRDEDESGKNDCSGYTEEDDYSEDDLPEYIIFKIINMIILN